MRAPHELVLVVTANGAALQPQMPKLLAECAVTDAASGHEACGSPGEVANEPARGNAEMDAAAPACASSEAEERIIKQLHAAEARVAELESARQATRTTGRRFWLFGGGKHWLLCMRG